MIRLEQNYRSRQHPRRRQRDHRHNNSNRLGKNLWTDQGAGEPIRVFEALRDADEARWIVEEIQSLVRDGICAATSRCCTAPTPSRACSSTSCSPGIPYRVYGGLRFFERQEIKHALAYLRLIANPDDDTVSRGGELPRPRHRRAFAGGAGRRRAHLQHSLYATVPHLSGKPGSALAGAVRLVEDLRRDTAGLPLPGTGRSRHRPVRPARAPEADKEGRERLENLDELINAAANFNRRGGPRRRPAYGAAARTVLADFLAHASLEAGDHQADAGARTRCS